MAINTLEGNSFYKFFEILKGKFSKIILLNAFFFTAFTLILALVYGINTLINPLISGLNGVLAEFISMLSFFPFVLLGPVLSAIMKLMRDFVREEPGFFWQDFKKAFKDNFRQSIIIAIIQFFVVFVLVVAMTFYYQNRDYSWFYVIGLGVSGFVALAYIVSSYYINMMIVTLDLKIKEIIKNSLIFTLLCFVKNLLLTGLLVFWGIVNFILALSAFYSGVSLVYGLVIAFCMTLTFGIAFYIIAFFTFPSIKQYILDPYYEEHQEESSASVANKPKLEGDTQQKELPEFVYHNGKMVSRKALEEEQLFID